MTKINILPVHLRPRREKLFGHGRPRPLDREGKVRVMVMARALMRRTEAGRHYGPITAKAYAVLQALLWGFHNVGSGLCFPSYEAIAEAAGCARSTVAEAIKALERAGVLTWVNRLIRVRERCQDLFGQAGSRVRVIRTSNAYSFTDPKGAPARRAGRGHSSKSESRSGTLNQDFISHPAPLNPDLDSALGRLLDAMKCRERDDGARPEAAQLSGATCGPRGAARALLRPSVDAP